MVFPKTNQILDNKYISEHPGPMKTVVYLMLFCAFALVGRAADEARRIQARDVWETVYRYQIKSVGDPNFYKVFFLSLQGRDPSDEFMKRFVENKLPVRKKSDSRYGKGKGLVDKETGGEGTLFQISSFKWVSDTEVEIKGGWYVSPIGAEFRTYTVKKENGKWVVTKSISTGIA